MPAPKRSQSSQDMLQQPFPSPAKPNPSLASTPEKGAPHLQSPAQTPASQPPEQLKDARKKGGGSDPGEPPAKGGAPGWGLMGRVASGLLGAGTKKGGADKKGVCNTALDWTSCTWTEPFVLGTSSCVCMVSLER